MSFSTVLLLIACVFISYYVGVSVGKTQGWIDAHLTVADECRKLGKFYVGKTIFTCTHIEENSSKEEDK